MPATVIYKCQIIPASFKKKTALFLLEGLGLSPVPDGRQLRDP